MTRTRRVAANTVETGSTTFEPGVVEINDGLAVAAEPLTEESAATEWLGGTITLKPNANGTALEAYHNGKRIK
jgi:hypothetical protein